MRYLFYWIIIGFWLVGCSAAGESVLPSPSPSRTAAAASATLPPTPTETQLPPTRTPAQASPTPVPDTPVPACVTLFYEDYAQVEVIGAGGGRVLVDVYDPARLSSPATEQDVLLTTHTHWDHVNAEFLEAFPGQQLKTQAGSLELAQGKVWGIASAHNASDRLAPEGGTNYIYLIEMGGLRIAHFGDIGQKELLAEQLEALGRVDVAIMQLANPYSEMSAENRKGFQLMQQVNPRLIIPTHIDLDTARIAVAEWQGLYSDTTSVRICEDNLSAQTQVLFLGQAAEQFAERLKLMRVDETVR